MEWRTFVLNSVILQSNLRIPRQLNLNPEITALEFGNDYKVMCTLPQVWWCWICLCKFGSAHLISFAFRIAEWMLIVGERAISEKLIRSSLSMFFCFFFRCYMKHSCVTCLQKLKWNNFRCSICTVHLAQAVPMEIQLKATDRSIVSIASYRALMSIWIIRFYGFDKIIGLMRVIEL